MVTFWASIHHQSHEQKNRQKWARDNNRIITSSLNKKTKEAVYQGTSGTYKTSLENCTCEDFELRKLPCKHIYRLAYELDIIERPKKGGFRIPKADKETTRKDMGIPEGTIFHIKYQGSKGDVSERNIEIQKITEVKDKIYLYAYCHMRKTVRSFLVSRIISMDYSGRQIKNLQEILNLDYSSPADLIENLVKIAINN